MDADVRELLEDAASAPRRPVDASVIAAAGHRRRMRARATRTLAAIVLLLGIGSGLALVGPVNQGSLEFADPPPESDPGVDVWPLRGRATLTFFNPEADDHRVYEFAATGWDDWLVVRLGVAQGEAPLTGQVHALRRSGDESRVASFDMEDRGGPFHTLERTSHAQFEPIDMATEPVPADPLHAIVGMPDFDEVVVLDDLPERSAEVAERLGIDPALVEGARIDIGEEVELVWLAGADMVLYWRDERFQIEVTSLELGAGIPIEERIARVEPSWRLHRDEARGFEVQHPEGWHYSPDDLVPQLGDPREVVTVSDGPMPIGSDPGCPVPAIAMQGIEDDGVLVTVQHAGPVERFAEGDIPEKPQQFRLESGTSDVPFAECGRDDATTVWFAFEIDGHALYALVTLGPDVSEEQAEQALGVLDSFRVLDGERLPEPDGSAMGPLECTGGPADPPACDDDHALPEEELP